MDVPDDLEALLRHLVQSEAAASPLSADDRAFIDHILTSITHGSKGVFVVLHPNDKMQYMLLNTDRVGAIALLARVMQRTAEALQADLD
jgi:hypothetical protein